MLSPVKRARMLRREKDFATEADNMIDVVYEDESDEEN